MVQAQETADVGVSAEVEAAEEEEEAPEEGTPSGGPGGATIPNTTPPLIFNLRSIILSPTQAVVLWQTDKEANTVLEFAPDDGVTPYDRVTDPNRAVVHEVPLSGLRPCTGYRYRARSTDMYGYEAISTERVLSMPCDVLRPELIGVNVVEITDHSAMVVWITNEPTSSRVEYGQTVEYGRNLFLPGFVVMHAVPISGLAPDTEYHVRAISQDPTGNTVTSGDVPFRTLPDRTPPANVGLSASPGDTEVLLRWQIPATTDVAGVRLIRKMGGFPTGPTDGLLIFDGTGESFLDTGLQNGVRYYYGAYAYDLARNVASGSIASAVPRAPGMPVEPGDGLPGTVTDPVTPGGSSADVRLFGAGGAVVLGRGADGAIGALAGQPVIMRVTPAEASDILMEAYVLFEGKIYPAVIGSDGFEAMIALPDVPDIYALRVRARFLDGQITEWEFPLRVQGPGRVFIRPLVGPAWRPIDGAVITLFWYDGNRWLEWDGGSHGQSNPLLTNQAGEYAFQVPPGRYRIEVEKQGYVKYQTSAAFIDGNVVGFPIKLIQIPVLSGLAEGAGVIDKGIRALFDGTAKISFKVKMLAQAFDQSPLREAGEAAAILFAVFGIWNAFAFSHTGIHMRVRTGMRAHPTGKKTVSVEDISHVREHEKQKRHRIALGCVVLGGLIAGLAPTVAAIVAFSLDVGCSVIFWRMHWGHTRGTSLK
ncbi:MAG: hypothetical protein RL141_954 [Candidatus Parcubacteria bacterium]|jgi:hypothetical protein